MNTSRTHEIHISRQLKKKEEKRGKKKSKLDCSNLGLEIS
jgi:hypothetical protein